MSFSGDIKIELSKMNNLKNKQEVYAEFLGYLVTINLDEKNDIKFLTESQYNINRFSKLLSNINIVKYKIEIQGKNYIITFKNQEKFKEIDTEYLQTYTNTDNLKKAFIRGTFLGGGYLNDPQNKYHMEIGFSKSAYAEYAVNILNEFGIKAKLLNREKETSLYIKDGEEISKCLALIGANSSVIKFEEVRVIRDMKNNVNRLVNCETANLNKTIGAAVEQTKLIKAIKKSGKFNSLPDDLKEIANLREKNPNATLEELGKMLSKPIGKSSVSHRFKKIKEYL